MIDYKKQWDCIVQFCCCNSSPRGDGNGESGENSIGHNGCNSSPRGDGNILFALFGCQGSLRCNSSPRGDGNCLASLPASEQSQGCNSSPRGDGNDQPSRLSRTSTTLQFIPARGRKLIGREELLIGAGLQFIPARGRKQPMGGQSSRPGQLQFIPARGRKLCICSKK